MRRIHIPKRGRSGVEEAILQRSLEHPTHGCVRVAQELVLKGIQVVCVVSEPARLVDKA